MIIVVQRHSTILEGVLGVGELVLDLVLVELHVDVVVPGQGVTRLLFLLLTELILALLLNILKITLSELNLILGETWKLAVE